MRRELLLTKCGSTSYKRFTRHKLDSHVYQRWRNNKADRFKNTKWEYGEQADRLWSGRIAIERLPVISRPLPRILIVHWLHQRASTSFLNESFSNLQPKTIRLFGEGQLEVVRQLNCSSLWILRRSHFWWKLLERSIIAKNTCWRFFWNGMIALSKQLLPPQGWHTASFDNVNHTVFKSRTLRTAWLVKWCRIQGNVYTKVTHASNRNPSCVTHHAPWI